ncbi:MAG: DUF3142 domain-containing protein [Verrucomicrobiota bacterium]|nr:DUF3142 domain-containing protein [Verrucomicrobiota bacterium]
MSFRHFTPRFHALRQVAFCIYLALLAGCEDATLPRTSAPLIQRGYLWQRDWTPAVADAFAIAEQRFDGVIILGGEIDWADGAPRLLKSSLRWDAIAAASKPTTLALRVAPFGGPFASDDANARFLVASAKTLLADADTHHAKIAAFQLDFDCAQKKLAGYEAWLRALHAALRPMPLSITTLPSWLDEPEFGRLINLTDDYVLQVHSVPARGADGQAKLCDPQLAQHWVDQAARLGRPFTVALPTYRCLAGYDADGKLRGVAMDAVQPSWPNETRVLEFAADPDAIASLVRAWQHERLAFLRGVVWYRVPSEADLRNWRWPTLNAVMQGRAPTHQLEVTSAGENPVDLELVNQGEAEERFAGRVTASWENATLVASDSVAGWTLQTTPGGAVFQADGLRLLPGERRGIGWLRYDRPAQPQLVLSEGASTTR